MGRAARAKSGCMPAESRELDMGEPAQCSVRHVHVGRADGNVVTCIVGRTGLHVLGWRKEDNVGGTEAFARCTSNKNAIC